MNSVETPVFVDQTKKYVHIPAEREYVTTSAPNDNPLFSRFIATNTYAEVLSGIVVACVDMLVYDPETERVLIGKRQQEPHSGDWVIGGRMRAGESIAASATRNMKRELGFAIDPSKLRTVGHYNLIWDSRDQPALSVMGSGPDENHIVGQSTGCHMTSTVELYPMDRTEIAQIDHNEEYSSLRWLGIEDVLTAQAGTYHPALLDMVGDGLEAITTPGPAITLAEQQLRLQGAAATARTALKHFELTHPNQ